MSSTGNQTNLVKTDDNTKWIPTLSAAAGTTASSLADNTWGYRQDNTGNFLPYTTTEILSNTAATNEDNTTLSFASKINYNQAAGSYAIDINFVGTVNPMATYMQDMDPTLCTTDPTTVVDKRDGEEYTVQRLADGNCWLLENLRLDLTDATVQANLTSATTNATDANLTNLKANVSTTWSATYTDPRINTAYKDTTQAAAGYAPAGKIGVYYNYCAASASSYCMASSSASDNASQDVCPKGWRMFTGGASGEYQALYTAYSSNAANFMTALRTPLSGYFQNNSAGGQGSYGHFWSSTIATGGSMYAPYVIANAVYPNTYYSRATYGFSVRCILKTMQNFNSQDVGIMAVGDTRTLPDIRDGEMYTIAKLPNNKIWMIDNLRFTGNASGTMSLDTTTSNVETTVSFTYGNLSEGNSIPEPRIATGVDDGDNPTVWYNYAAASATQITSQTTTQATRSICPKGWKLPANTDFSAITSYTTAFNPVAGGFWRNKAMENPAAGGWWASNTTNSSPNNRYVFVYYSSALAIQQAQYYNGYYIRCIYNN